MKSACCCSVQPPVPGHELEPTFWPPSVETIFFAESPFAAMTEATFGLTFGPKVCCQIDQAVRTGVKLYRLDYLAHSTTEVAKNQAVIAKAQGRGLEVDLVMGGTEHAGWSISAATYG